METDYSKYRGNCKELSEKAILDDPSLTLVRGHYDCPLWGKQQHWWTVKPDGTIFDPSKKQFLSTIGEYIPFDGICTCEECGKKIKEEHAIIMGRFPVCSDTCAKRLVGL